MTKARNARILTRHPDPDRSGVNIERDKYDAMAAALLAVLPVAEPGVPFGELRDRVRPHLPADVFTPDVSVSWYVTTVKLDLEARGRIRRLPGRGPQRLVRRAGRR